MCCPNVCWERLKNKRFRSAEKGAFEDLTRSLHVIPGEIESDSFPDFISLHVILGEARSIGDTMG
jgi:hypothetical protein